ncbi:MAG: redoxin family protein [Candidatus Dormibacteria bacterium]
MTTRFRVGLALSLLAAVALVLVYAIQRQPNVAGRGSGASAQSANLLPTDQRPSAPELVGIDAWVNSPPLKSSELRGKVVLIDFWTYSCINCLRTIPGLQHLNATYASRGLVIIGVHSPEFDFEKDLGNVKRAVQRDGVTWPVALDSEMATWNAFQNTVWPAEFLIDQQGRIADATQGEGVEARTEADIATLLQAPPPASATAEPAPNAETPELYAGSDRGHLADGESYGHPDWTQTDPGAPHDNDHIQLVGSWHDAGQYVESRSDGIIRLRFAAHKVFIVAGNASGSALNARVTVDGHAVPTNQRGEDVSASGAVAVSMQTLYRVLSAQDPGHHLVEIRVPAGFRLYTFTFG